MHTEEDNGGMSGGFLWKAMNTLLGAAGTATGITALATKVPKEGNGCGCRSYRGYGAGPVVVNDGVGAPTAFQAWEKSCDDAVALTAAIYRGQIREMEQAAGAREIDVNEKFRIWKSQVDGDFGLYKEMRDRDDAINARIGELETKVAVSSAIRPYQDALIGCKIDKVADYAAFALDRRTCRMIEGELVLPSTPTVTGFQSASRCGRQVTAATQG